jgi:hypothetical protein
MIAKTTSLNLKFHLAVEDDWPPVSVESLPFIPLERSYNLLDPPLFINNLSVGDIINADIDEDNFVLSWYHIHRSRRSTIWLLRLKQSNSIRSTLIALRKLKCNTVSLETLGCYSVDVPEDLKITIVDAVLGALDDTEVAVAFPSLRHPD